MHSGDPPLRCNLLACRRSLTALSNDHAVVTTCSHVLCEPCATAAFSSALVCPACETPLPEPEDIALTTLNPSERYKSSVLSGLPPSVIHDIAGRALSFWVYQISEECALLELSNNQAEARAQESEARANALTAQSNQELAVLRDQLNALEQDRELDRRRIHDLTEQCAEKNRELARLQVQMDHLRRKSIVPAAAGGGGGGSGEFACAEPHQLQQSDAGALGRPAMALAARDTGGARANGPTGVATGMHWTTAAAGAGHDANGMTTWRPWNLSGNRAGGSGGGDGKQQPQVQDRMMSCSGSVIPLPMAAVGVGTRATDTVGSPITTSVRSTQGPALLFGAHAQQRRTPPAPGHQGFPQVSRNPHGQNAPVEWVHHQAGQPLQQLQHGGQGQRRSSKTSGGRSQTRRRAF